MNGSKVGRLGLGTDFRPFFPPVDLAPNTAIKMAGLGSDAEGTGRPTYPRAAGD